MPEHVHEWAFSVYFPHVYCKCGETMAVKEANLRLNEYETLKAANEALENERVTLCVLLQEWLRWGLKQPFDIVKDTQAAMERNKRPLLEGKDERTKPIR